MDLDLAFVLVVIKRLLLRQQQLCQEQPHRRPLRLVLMSATANAGRVAEFFSALGPAHSRGHTPSGGFLQRPMDHGSSGAGGNWNGGHDSAELDSSVPIVRVGKSTLSHTVSKMIL